MSNVIDSKVVEMKFDNKDFEQNVSTSMNTLEKLQNKLNFSDASKAFGELDSASRRVNFSDFGQAIETVQVKFKALETMAIGALMNIGAKAADAGIQLVQSLSTDQVAAGWDKYADKTTSVQTIMAATADQFNDVGEQMEYVSDQLDMLNWFTDETSYNFTDMTNNIGKFTSAGVELDKAAKAMMGIANVAAISGQNAQAAGRAMYNFSQALGMGYVGLQDWMSIENANMATKEFKNTLIETAKELGVIKDGAVTIQNFRTTLNDKWLNADVLMDALDKYGGFSVKLAETMRTIWDDGSDLTTSQVIKLVEAYKINEEELQKQANIMNVTIDDLIPHLKELADDSYNLGLKSFKAGQEAKTFAEALGSVEDAVSTGWMTTFERIFGNYQQAKELWTDLANELYDVFAESGNARNAMLADWAKATAGGRQDLIDAFWTMWYAIRKIMDTIRKAFEEIFPPKTSEDLQNLVLGFKRFAESLQISNEELDKLKRTFKGVFAIFRIIGSVVGQTFSAFKHLLSGIKGVNLGISDVTASWGDWLTNLAETIDREHVIENAINRVIAFIKRAYHVVKGFINDILDTPFVKKTLGDIQSVIGSVWDNICKYFNDMKSSVDGFVESIGGIHSISDVFEIFKYTVKKIFDDIVGIFRGSNQSASNEVVSLGDNINNTFSNIGDYFKNLFDNMSDALNNYTIKIGSFEINIGAIFSKIKTLFEDFVGYVASRFVGSSTKSIVAILISIIGTVAGINVLKSIVEKVDAVRTAMTGILSSFSGLLNSTSKFMKSVAAKNYAETFKIIAESILMIAGAIAILTFVDMVAPIDKAAITVAAIMGALAVLIAAAGATLVLAQKQGAKLYEFGVIAAGLGIALMGMVSAFTTLMSLDYNANVIGAAIALVVMLGALMGTVIGMSRLSGPTKTGMLTLIGIALSVQMLVNSLKSIADMDPGRLMGSLLIVGALLGVLVFIVKLGNDSKFGLAIGNKFSLATAGNSGGSSFGFAALGAAIAVIVLLQALKMASKMNPAEIKKGLEAILPVMLAMGMLISASILAGKYANKAGLMLISVSAAMLILVGVMELLSMMDISDINQGMVCITAIGVLFAMLIGVSKFAGENAHKTAPMLLAFAGAVAILSIVLWAVGDLDMEIIRKGMLVVGFIGVLLMGLSYIMTKMTDVKTAPISLLVAAVALLGGLVLAIGLMVPEEKYPNILRSVVALGVLLLAFTASLKMLSGNSGIQNIPRTLASFGMLIVLVASMTALVLALGAIPAPDKLLPTVIGIGILLLALVGSVKILGDRFDRGIGPKAVGTLAVMLILMGFLSTFMIMLNYVNPDNMLVKITSLGLLFVAMIGALVVLSIIPNKGLGITSIAAMIALGFVLELIANSFIILNQLNPDRLIPMAASLSIVLLSMMAATVILGLLGTAALSAIIGVAAMGVMMLELAGLFYLMNEWSSQESTIKKGIAVCNLLGEGLGEFFGSIFKGIGDKLTEDLPLWGLRIGLFALNIQPFTNMLEKMKDKNIVDTMSSFCGALLMLGEAELINSLANIVNLFAGDEGDSIGDKLLNFVGVYKSFAEALSDDSVKTISNDKMNSIYQVARLADVLPKFGGLLSVFTGETDMTRAGEMLANWGGSYKTFTQKVKAADALKEGVIDDMIAVCNFFKDAPKFGGIVGWFEGTTDLDTVGGQIQRFVMYFTNFVKDANLVEKLNRDVLDDMAAVSTWAESTPKFGGFMQLFDGEIKLDTFGDNLTKFIEGFKTFADTAYGTKVVTESKLDNMTLVLDWMDKDVPDYLDDKSAKLYTIGQGIGSFASAYSQLAGISRSANTINTEGLSKMGAFAVTLTSSISEYKIDTGRLDSFSSSLSSLGSGFGVFAGHLSNVDFDNADRANTWLDKLVDISESFKDNNTKGAISSLEDELDRIGNSFVNFADGVSAIGGSVEISAMSIAKAFSEKLAQSFVGPEASAARIDMLSTIRGWFKNIAENIIDDIDLEKSRFSSAAKQMFNYFIDGWSVKYKNDKTISDDISKIINVQLMPYKTEFYTIGEYFMQGFKQGMESYENIIAASADHLGFVASEALRKALDEHSPSKITEEIGKFFTEGFANGINNATNKALESVTNLGEGSTSELEKTLSTIGSYVDGNMDITPTISPVLDLSNVTSGLSDLGGLFGATRSIDFSSYAGDLFNSNLLSSKKSLSAKDFKMEELFSGLSNKLTELTSKVGNLQVVMDTGTLVGQITGPLDTALGTKISRNTRGGM